MPSGLFVTFEGGEHAGKSTQVAAVAALAAARRMEVVTTREPGGTPLGERLRETLFSSNVAPSPVAELLIFAAARAELVHTCIRPALERGALVLCDRFADSTVAYQGYGRGLDLHLIHSMNAVATQGVYADITVLLDLPASEASTRTVEGDYMEREDRAFHERVREGFLAIAADEPQRFLVLDATQDREALTRAIWARIERARLR
jgi:dTMP kinase